MSSTLNQYLWMSWSLSKSNIARDGPVTWFGEPETHILIYHSKTQTMTLEIIFP